MGSWPSIAEGCAFATQTRSPSIGCSSARSLGATSPIGRRPGTSTSTSTASSSGRRAPAAEAVAAGSLEPAAHLGAADEPALLPDLDRKSTRLNSSHVRISYAVFCLKKKKEQIIH